MRVFEWESVKDERDKVRMCVGWVVWGRWRIVRNGFRDMVWIGKWGMMRINEGRKGGRRVREL